MNKTHTLLVGSLTVSLGLATFAMTNGTFGLSYAGGWPLYLVIPGCFLLAAIFTTKAHIARVLCSIFGTLLLLLGGLFLVFSSGVVNWKEASTLWPLFIMTAGASQLITFILEGRRTKPLLMVSIGLIIGGAILLFFMRMGSNSTILDKSWPILIVVLGMGITFAANRRSPN
jgi:hypothetical protein